MRGFWRYPAVPVGVVLVVLGLGNWVGSHSKVMEYEQQARQTDPVEGADSLRGFSRLTPRTSATLLDRLQPHFGDYGVAAARRDFYAVVQSGGRIIAVIGLLSVGIGLLQRWRERRGERLSAPPPARAA